MIQHPQMIVGTRRWIEYVRSYFDLEHAKRMDKMCHDAVYGPDAPTHFIETADKKLGYGQTFAEAFSDLVAGEL